MLFDWLVIGHVIDVNPAHAVHGPKYVVKKGKTSVLTAEEARELLDSISLARNTGRRRQRDQQPEFQESAVVGLRDRALIAVMVYSFARINAVLEMKVRDYFVQGRRGWVRLEQWAILFCPVPRSRPRPLVASLADAFSTASCTSGSG